MKATTIQHRCQTVRCIGIVIGGVARLCSHPLMMTVDLIHDKTQGCIHLESSQSFDTSAKPRQKHQTTNCRLAQRTDLN
jgi:hypothetical protein